MGRHRPYRLFAKRAVRTPLLVVAAFVLIGAGTVILRSVSADADGCSNSAGTRLTVAADPAIAPAIAEIGARWTRTKPAVHGQCIRVEVVAQPSFSVAEGLATWAGGHIDVAAKPAPTPEEADLPVVWIPDSSYWVGRVLTADRNMFEGVAVPVASSPVVLAVAESVARGLEAELAKGLDAPTIRELVADPSGRSPLKLAMVEPRRDSAGLIGAMMLSDAVVASEEDLPRLVFAYRSIGAQVNDTESLWKAFAEGITAAPVSEQALLAYNAANSSSPVAAVGVPDVPTLDFPYAVRARQPRETTAAAMAFRKVLTSGNYDSVLARHRLRSPDGRASSGFPTGHGVSTAGVHVQPLIESAKVEAALRVWVAARTPSRVIAMVDATSSMDQQLGGGRARLDVMREAAIYGLSLFTDDSEVGLWGFAGQGHVRMVPLGRLGQDGHRERLTDEMKGASTRPTDVTPLYQSILAGYRQLLDGYKPELSNTLVVFTDGSDNTGEDLRAVQRELEVLADVTRPVRVVLLGIGPDVKLDDLGAIAKTTGGVAFQVSNAEDMRGIFLKALLA